MAKKVEKKTKPSIWKSLIGFLIFLVLVLVAGFIAYRVAEARLFKTLASQPGMQITIGSRQGNLFSGYTLSNVSIHSDASGDSPATTFITPKLVIRWILRPPSLTYISWDTASYKVQASGKPEEEIPIGAGVLSPSTAPDRKGWLVSQSPISVGPDSWHGVADLNLTSDIKRVEGTLSVQNLPVRFLSLAATVPSDFSPLGNIILEMQFEGNPQGMRASGVVTDPFTRESFRF
jgi:hypothetical protein